MKGENGVTILEITVVIACLAIFAAIAVPQWITNGRPAFHLRIAAREIVTDIRYARARAVATNRQFRLRFDPENNTCFLEKGDADSGSVLWSGEGPSRHFGQGGNTSASGVIIVGDDEYFVIFQPTGGMTSRTITLQNTRGQTIKVICSMAGRVRLVRE